MSCLQLPEGYEAKAKVELSKNKKTAAVVSIVASVVTVAVLLLGIFVQPLDFINIDFQSITSLLFFLLYILLLLAAYIAYMVLHELTHGLFMWIFAKVKPNFGVKLPLYAYCGSDKAYFSKWQYIVISLAPVVVWGIVFGVLAAFLTDEWFWLVWFLQAGNIGGAAGDFYVAAKTLKCSKTVLIMDTGVDMTYYDKTSEETL